MFDVVLSALALVALAPWLVLIAIAIRIESQGSVLYRGARAGKWGEPFQIFKFRTMRTDADRTGPAITSCADIRQTRFGRFLRRSKLDELPQLINVLRGEMSIVGPRPEDPRYLSLYTPQQLRVLNVRPGMTSPASIRYRHEAKILPADAGDSELTYATRILPNKLRMDLDYIDRQSFFYDIEIIVRTVAALLHPSRSERDLSS